MHSNDATNLISPSIGRRILWISLSLLGAQLIGSAFNIWYNLSRIRPLLDAEQKEAFAAGIRYFNVIVYPIAFAIWIGIVLSISRAWKGSDPNSDHWRTATRRMINLPWIAIGVSGAAWLLSIPVLLLAVHSATGTLDSQVNLHLPVSIIVAALISLALGFFIVEILVQKFLYPLFLKEGGAADIPGTFQITLKRRGMIWAVSAVVCPILSLMLLFVVSGFDTKHDVWFPLSVGAVGIVFGLVSAWLQVANRTTNRRTRRRTRLRRRRSDEILSFMESSKTDSLVQINKRGHVKDG